MNEKYFAVQFWSDRNKTTGIANKENGKMNIACDIAVFSSQTERDNYVSEGVDSFALDGNCREVVTRNEARNLCLGMSDTEFDAYIEKVIDDENTQLLDALAQNIRLIDELKDRYK